MYIPLHALMRGSRGRRRRRAFRGDDNDGGAKVRRIRNAISTMDPTSDLHDVPTPPWQDDPSYVVARLVARRASNAFPPVGMCVVENRKVGGSTPPLATTRNRRSSALHLRFFNWHGGVPRWAVLVQRPEPGPST